MINHFREARMSRRTIGQDGTVHRYSGFATEIHFPSWRSKEPPKDRGSRWNNIHSQTIQINSWPYQKGLFLNNFGKRKILSRYPTRVTVLFTQSPAEMVFRDRLPFTAKGKFTARQRSCGKVMFSQVSVYREWGFYSLGPYPHPGPQKQVVRILLKCFLVKNGTSQKPGTVSAVDLVNSTFHWNTSLSTETLKKKMKNYLLSKQYSCDPVRSLFFLYSNIGISFFRVHTCYSI